MRDCKFKFRKIPSKAEVINMIKVYITKELLNFKYVVV